MAKDPLTAAKVEALAKLTDLFVALTKLTVQLTKMALEDHELTRK